MTDEKTPKNPAPPGTKGWRIQWTITACDGDGDDIPGKRGLQWGSTLLSCGGEHIDSDVVLVTRQMVDTVAALRGQGDLEELEGSSKISQPMKIEFVPDKTPESRHLQVCEDPSGEGV